MHFSNVVWVGLLPGTGEDREINPFDAKSPKETALELTEANLVTDLSGVIDLLRAAGQDHLAQLLLDNESLNEDQQEEPFTGRQALSR